MVSEPEEAKYLEVTIEPIPPDTISSAKAEILPLIEAALRETGREQLLTDGQMQIEIERTFPTDEVIVIGFTLMSGIAFETYKAIVLPVLKKRFRAWQKQRRKARRKSKRKK